MDKKLEARIKRLENILYCNEDHDRKRLGQMAMNALKSITEAESLVSQIAIALDYDGSDATAEWESLDNELNSIILKLNKMGFDL